MQGRIAEGWAVRTFAHVGMSDFETFRLWIELCSGAGKIVSRQNRKLRVKDNDNNAQRRDVVWSKVMRVRFKLTASLPALLEKRRYSADINAMSAAVYLEDNSRTR